MAMTKEQFLWMKLMEECSELAQISSKTAQFGVDEIHPEKQQTNLRRVIVEFNDILAIIDLLFHRHGIYIPQDTRLQEAKKDKLDKYMQYSINLGRVEGTIDGN